MLLLWNLLTFLVFFKCCISETVSFLLISVREKECSSLMSLSEPLLTHHFKLLLDIGKTLTYFSSSFSLLSKWAQNPVNRLYLDWDYESQIQSDTISLTSTIFVFDAKYILMFVNKPNGLIAVPKRMNGR